MVPLNSMPAAPTKEQPPIGWVPWLTARRLIFFVIGWLMLFAVLSFFVSNPFQSESNAGATPDYARVMFLHGLLIGMVGLLALLTCQVLCLRSRHTRAWILGGTLVATILAAVGGIWDRTIPGSEVPMWTQIAGFFALDEILIVLLIGIIGEWRNHAPGARSLPFVAATVASASMLMAALMGHLLGWMMEFGSNPPIISDFYRFAGFASQDDFTGVLLGSHSHDMAVSVMALTVVLVAQQFGYRLLRGASWAITRTGMALLTAGIAVTMVMYAAMAFTLWSPPTFFASPDGVNGIAGDDIITGILVMGGGVIVIAGLLVGRFGKATSLIRQPVRLAAVWSWVLSFATVVVAGYAIEMNESYFGAGDQGASGAAKDAIFTWLHQDIGLFLLPALVLMMLAVERLIDHGQPGLIGWTAILGTTVAFVGGMIYTFVNPDLYGPGYIVSTVGLVIVGLALLATLWWGTLGYKQQAAPPTAPELERVAASPEPELIKR